LPLSELPQPTVKVKNANVARRVEDNWSTAIE
jgi:hypothetical protein